MSWLYAEIAAASQHDDSERIDECFAAMIDVVRLTLGDPERLATVHLRAAGGMARSLAAFEQYGGTPELMPATGKALQRLSTTSLAWSATGISADRQLATREELDRFFKMFEVDAGSSLDIAPSLPKPWRGTWVGTLRLTDLGPALNAEIEKTLRNEIKIEFFPIEDDPTRATLVIRTDVIAGDGHGAAMLAMARERNLDEEAERFTIRCIDTSLGGWVVEKSDILVEIREQLEGDELAKAEAMLERCVLSAGQPTEDRFEICFFDPEFKGVHSYRMRLVSDDTMEYEVVTMFAEASAGGTVVRQSANLDRTD